MVKELESWSRTVEWRAWTRAPQKSCRFHLVIDSASLDDLDFLQMLSLLHSAFVCNLCESYDLLRGFLPQWMHQDNRREFRDRP